MVLTYTEIEHQKNTRIIIFFAVVLAFYFFIAFFIASLSKIFFLSQAKIYTSSSLWLTPRQCGWVILIAGSAGIIHIVYSLTHAMRFIEKNLDARYLDPNDTYHQRFKRTVEEVNVAAGNRYTITPVVLPTVAMNAFAIADHKKQALLGITEGLLSKLSPQQLQGVVAHEMAHIASGDSFQTTIACSLFGIYSILLEGIKKLFRGGGRVRLGGRGAGMAYLFLLITYLSLNVLQFFFNLIRLFISRDRELRADAIAVRLTRDPISLSEALFAISRGWRGLGAIQPSWASLFIMHPTIDPTQKKTSWWQQALSTHPPLEKRVQILAYMAHSNAADIKQHVLTHEQVQELSREMPKEAQKAQWMARNKDAAWEGPFTIAQMMTLGWMRPDTWVQNLTQQSVTQAKDIPEVKPIFNERLRSHVCASLNCPHCDQALIDETYEGTSAHRCVFCNGVLIEKDKIPRIIIREKKGFDERVKKLAELTQENGIARKQGKIKEASSFIPCPKCNVEMLRNFYTMAYLVEVDQCPTCQLVWFDQNELEILQYLIEHQMAV